MKKVYEGNNMEIIFSSTNGLINNKKDGCMKNNSIIILSYFVALLNLFDGLATNYGLLNDFIEESNPIMAVIASVSPVLFISLKLLLSIIIIIVSYFVYNKSSAKFQSFYFFMLLVVCAIYIGIGCIHIYWLFIL